ncbi:MAG: inositol monophosphatase [Patescibacteria group bacterium]
MYQQIIDKIIKLGDSLPSLAGDIADIGKNKQWLTKKDIEIETELKKLISTFSGNHSVYAEELNDVFVKNENVWIIDPISNTINFIHGLPHYSVVLSHLYQGEVLFSVVYDPSNKELFTAEKGKGTFLNGNSVKVSNRTKDFIFLGPGLMLPEPLNERALKILSLISTQGSVRILGSLGVHYAYVACGRADVAISFNKDTFPEFAGKLLVEEAGGKFTDFHDKPLTPTTYGVIATSGTTVHNEMRNLLSDYLISSRIE